GARRLRRSAGFPLAGGGNGDLARREHPREDSYEQFVLGGEDAKEIRVGDAHLLGDADSRAAVQALLAELDQRGVEDLFATLGDGYALAGGAWLVGHVDSKHSLSRRCQALPPRSGRSPSWL